MTNISPDFEIKDSDEKTVIIVKQSIFLRKFLEF